MGQLKLMYGQQAYRLSLDFVRQLQDKAADAVLQRDELAELAQTAGPEEKQFLTDVLQDNLMIRLPEVPPAKGKVVFGPMTLVDRQSSVTGRFYRQLYQRGHDGLLSRDDFTALEQAAAPAEKQRIEGFKAYGKISTLGIDGQGTLTSLSFVVSPDRNLSPELLQALGEHARDGLLDQADFAALRQLASSADDRAHLDELAELDHFSGLPVLDAQGQAQLLPQVDLSYSETQLVPGETPAEIVAHIGQGDRLEDTQTENFRCGAGASVNAVLLTRGREGFAALARSLHQPESLTYENIHRVQDALYLQAGGKWAQGDAARQSGLNLSTRTQGALRKAEGSQVKALELAGFQVEPLRGESEIRAFFARHPQATMLVTVARDDRQTDFGAAEPNHAVLINFDKGGFYVSDTYARSGTGLNHRPLTASEQTAWFASSHLSLGNLPAEAP